MNNGVALGMLSGLAVVLIHELTRSTLPYWRSGFEMNQAKKQCHARLTWKRYAGMAALAVAFLQASRLGAKCPKEKRGHEAAICSNPATYINPDSWGSAIRPKSGATSPFVW